MTTEDRDDLKATAESIVADAERLKQLELRKLDLEPSAEETADLAAEAEKVGQRIADKTRIETDLVEAIAQTEPPK